MLTEKGAHNRSICSTSIFLIRPRQPLFWSALAQNPLSSSTRVLSDHSISTSLLNQSSRETHHLHSSRKSKTARSRKYFPQPFKAVERHSILFVSTYSFPTGLYPLPPKKNITIHTFRLSFPWHPSFIKVPTHKRTALRTPSSRLEEKEKYRNSPKLKEWLRKTRKQ